MNLLQQMRMHDPRASLGRIAFWDWLIRPTMWFLSVTFWRYRMWGATNVPAEGPLLLVSNHQSFLDLVTIGNGMSHRHFHSMARDTLFKHPLFAAYIRALNAYPVQQGKADVKSLRYSVDLLKAGQAVLIFAEGSRTPDGTVKPFSPGIMLMIRRAKPTIVPVGLDGGYDIWPIHGKRLRWSGRLGVQFGQPIPAEQLLAMDAEQATEHLRQQIDTLRLEVRRKLRLASNGRYPARDAGESLPGE